MSTTPFILVVDDHTDTRELYRMALEDAHYEVADAKDAESALAMASSRMPSVVVTDIRMPGRVSAVALCRYFSERGVPVVALTGLTQESAEVQQIQPHCARVLLKPVIPETLREALVGVLRAAAAAKPARN